jgi:hypothetical protein
MLTYYGVTVYVYCNGRFSEYSIPVIWQYVLLVIAHAATTFHNLFVRALRLKLTLSSLHKERVKLTSEINTSVRAFAIPAI